MLNSFSVSPLRKYFEAPVAFEDIPSAVEVPEMIIEAEERQSLQEARLEDLKASDFVRSRNRMTKEEVEATKLFHMGKLISLSKRLVLTIDWWLMVVRGRSKARLDLAIPCNTLVELRESLKEFVRGLIKHCYDMATQRQYFTRPMLNHVIIKSFDVEECLKMQRARRMFNHQVVDVV